MLPKPRAEVRQQLKFNGFKEYSTKIMRVVEVNLVMLKQAYRLLGVRKPGASTQTKLPNVQKTHIGKRSPRRHVRGSIRFWHIETDRW